MAKWKDHDDNMDYIEIRSQRAKRELGIRPEISKWKDHDDIMEYKEIQSRRAERQRGIMMLGMRRRGKRADFEQIMIDDR